MGYSKKYLAQHEDDIIIHKAIFEELRDIAEHDRSDEKERERDKRSRQ